MSAGSGSAVNSGAAGPPSAVMSGSVSSVRLRENEPADPLSPSGWRSPMRCRAPRFMLERREQLTILFSCCLFWQFLVCVTKICCLFFKQCIYSRLLFVAHRISQPYGRHRHPVAFQIVPAVHIRSVSERDFPIPFLSSFLYFLCLSSCFSCPHTDA